MKDKKSKVKKAQEIKRLNQELRDKAHEINILCQELNINGLNASELVKNIISDTADIEVLLIMNDFLEIGK